AVLFFFAWSFKQSAIGIFAGTLLALLFKREWSAAGILLVSFLGCVGAVLLASGDAYYKNVFISPALAPWVPYMVVQNVGLWVYYWGTVLVILPCVLVLCYPPQDRWRLLWTRRPFLVSIALVTSLVSSTLASGRLGAWSNYYFEPWIAGML